MDISPRSRIDRPAQTGEAAQPRPNRRRMLRWAAGAAGALTGAALAVTRHAEPAAAQTAAQHAPGVEGSWRLTVTLDGPQERAPLTLLATCTGDGSYVQTSAPGYSSGHGAWRQVGERRYALTSQQLVFDTETGEPLGTVTVQATISLDETGNAITAPFHFELRSLNGTAHDLGTGSARGTRIRVDGPA